VTVAPAIHTEALLYHRTFDGHSSAGYSRQYQEQKVEQRRGYLEDV
jgi:hypothetical protein